MPSTILGTKDIVEVSGEISKNTSTQENIR